MATKVVTLLLLTFLSCNVDGSMRMIGLLDKDMRPGTYIQVFGRIWDNASVPFQINFFEFELEAVARKMIPLHIKAYLNDRTAVNVLENGVWATESSSSNSKLAPGYNIYIVSSVETGNNVRTFVNGDPIDARVIDVSKLRFYEVQGDVDVYEVSVAGSEVIALPHYMNIGHLGFEIGKYIGMLFYTTQWISVKFTGCFSDGSPVTSFVYETDSNQKTWLSYFDELKQKHMIDCGEMGKSNALMQLRLISEEDGIRLSVYGSEGPTECFLPRGWQFDSRHYQELTITGEAALLDVVFGSMPLHSITGVINMRRRRRQAVAPIECKADGK